MDPDLIDRLPTTTAQTMVTLDVQNVWMSTSLVTWIDPTGLTHLHQTERALSHPPLVAPVLLTMTTPDDTAVSHHLQEAWAAGTGTVVLLLLLDTQLSPNDGKMTLITRAAAVIGTLPLSEIGMSEIPFVGHGILEQTATLVPTPEVRSLSL